MKLKIRCGSKAVIVGTDSSATLRSLKCQVLCHVDLTNESDVILSLNKQTALEGDEETLADLGIVSGDIMYVLNEPTVERARPHKSCAESSSATTTSIDRTEPLSINSSATSIDMQPSTAACKAKSFNSAMSFSREDQEVSNNQSVLSDLIINRYLNEPTLIRESTPEQLPQSVVCAFSLSQPDSSNLALVILVDILMCELGYQLTEATTRQLKDGVVKLDYKYPLLTGHGFQLMCIPMHGLLFIHGFVRQSVNILDKKQLQLKTSDYVKELTRDAISTFRASSLCSLSRLFKDAIGYPLLYSALQDTEDLQLPTLSSLVLELQLHIMKFLDAASLLRLSEVSRHLHDVATQPFLWRRLHIKDFGRKDDMKLAQNWLGLYKDKYLTKKRVSRMNWDTFGQSFERPYPAFSDPFPSGPPGFIIGGEYDLRPSFAPPPFLLSQFLRPQPMRFVDHVPPISALNQPFLPSIHPATLHTMRRSHQTTGSFMR